MRCMMCGTSVKPWFEVCFGCHSPVSGYGEITRQAAGNFRKEIKIDR